MLPCFNASNVVKGGIRMQESSAKLKVCTQTVPSGGRTAGYHRRSAVSFYLVTDGCVHILLQGREITVRENEGAFVNSGVLHGMESVGADAAVLQVTFPPEYVTGAEDPRLTARYADPIVKARERDCLLLRGSGWANDICDRLQLLPSVLSARRPGYELRAHILVSEIWLSLYEQTVPPPDRPCGVSLTEKKRMETLRQYIQDNYREKISLDDIASAAHISGAHQPRRVLPYVQAAVQHDTVSVPCALPACAQHLLSVGNRPEHRADRAERRLLFEQLLYQVLPKRIPVHPAPLPAEPALAAGSAVTGRVPLVQKRKPFLSQHVHEGNGFSVCQCGICVCSRV